MAFYLNVNEWRVQTATHPMKKWLILSAMMLPGMVVMAQNKGAVSTPPAVVSVISGITDKHFLPDTAFAALTDQDESLLVKEPVANWSLPQESGNMTYYNLVSGTRSYQLIVSRPPKSAYPTAMLLRYATPKSKPEPIARGTLRSDAEVKAK